MSPEQKFPSIDKFLLEEIYQRIGRPPVRLVFGDGVAVTRLDCSPVADIVIRDRRTLFELMLDPELGFGDGYCDGRITVRGNLIDALEAVYRSMSEGKGRAWYTKALSRLMDLKQQNSLTGARKNIHRHYDLPTSFFQLWLDPQLVYSCAYFPSAAATLEEAQLAKMNYICRKLQLQPGERVVDIGGGWGALAFHMARHFGVTVRAFNISHEQTVWARGRASELGLNHQVEFIEDDYRNLSGQCDALVSVGMLEHVGPEHYGEMGKAIDRALGKAGRGLLQTVGHNQALPFSTWTRKRIFPGTYAPTIRQMMDIFEPAGFSVLDVENLRPHYARTLEHWLARFERASERVTEMYNPEFTRAWRLYLSGALAGFRAGTLQLFQLVFARNAWRPTFWTRAHLYGEEQPEAREEIRVHAMN